MATREEILKSCKANAIKRLVDGEPPSLVFTYFVHAMQEDPLTREHPLLRPKASEVVFGKHSTCKEMKKLINSFK